METPPTDLDPYGQELLNDLGNVVLQFHDEHSVPQTLIDLLSITESLSKCQLSETNEADRDKITSNILLVTALSKMFLSVNNRLSFRP